MVELFNCLPAAPVLCTFVQYSIAFCSRPEVDSDVISGMVVDYFGMDVRVKFGDSRSNISRDIRGAD